MYERRNEGGNISFEEDFPSLKKKAHFVTEFKVGEIPEDEIITDRGKEKLKLKQEPHSFEGRSVNLVGDSCRVYNEEDIQKHCLDKQKRYNLTTKQLLDLFIKGESETGYGLKLSALHEPEKYGSLVKKIIDVKEYKQKVKKKLDWILGLHPGLAYDAVEVIKKELGLEK